jgi:hypothetical protein
MSRGQNFGGQNNNWFLILLIKRKPSSGGFRFFYKGMAFMGAFCILLISDSLIVKFVNFDKNMFEK